MKKRIRAALGPAVSLLVLLAALWLLRRELSAYRLVDIWASFVAIPPQQIVMALALTIVDYVILIGYDRIAVHYLGRQVTWTRIALGSLVGSAVANSLGNLLGGSTIRWRLYTSWGFSAVDVIKLVTMLSLTFWLGVVSLSSVVFLTRGFALPSRLHLPFSTTIPLGLCFAAIVIAYLLLCMVRRRPLHFRQWEIRIPTIRLAAEQIVVSSLDLLVAASVLYVLMPSSLEVGFVRFLAVYLLALVVALTTQVPGGLGVLELTVIVLLDPTEPHAVMGSLLAYRFVYYLIPLFIGLFVLATSEVLPHRRRLGQVAGGIARWSTIIFPRFLSVTVFLAGTILLFSGATPAETSRLRLLRALLPLPVLELSHLLGSVVGLLLLLLARALQRRIESAYYAVVALLTAGIVFSLLKGVDYEEALFLAVMLGLFLPCRGYFYRKSALANTRFTLQWLVAIALVLGCTFWLMLFAHEHFEYSNELWWQFTFSGDAPRSLRALATVVIVTLCVAMSRMMMAGPKPISKPSEADLELARAIVAKSPRTDAHLALLGDKYFLFSDNKSAMLMFAVEGRSCIAMGDPIGEEAECRELAWRFREWCDEAGKWPVFYQVEAARLAIYVEMGLQLLKLGEEARVPLAQFSLEGSGRKSLRRTYKQLTEAACEFTIVEPPLSDEWIGQLKQISDAWLGAKNTAEKGFSLGFFKPDYLRNCPIAILTQQGQPIAFANMWRGANREELSIDLMRHLPGAPHGSMDFLFVKLMLWGKEHGYKWFSLGMAPLSGVEARSVGPLWNRIASVAYRHGEHFYNFQGLRSYKDKFDPVWSQKYLACPGGWALPVVLTNLATLISGGVVRLVKK